MRAKIPDISIFQSYKDGLSFFASLIDALVGAALEALGGYIGNRPTSPSENDFGHIRVGITIATGAPFGAVPSFEVSVYGVEVP